MASLIRRPGKKVWYVQFKHNGRFKRLTTRTESKKIALEVLRKFQTAEAEAYNDLPIRRRVTLRELVEKYLAHCKTTQSPKWVGMKEWVFNRRLIPFFGENTVLRDITLARIEAYQQKRLKTVSSRSVNIETHHCLLTGMRKAVEWGMLEARSLPKVKKLQESGGRLRFLSNEEIEKLRQSAAMHSAGMETYVFLMLYAGLRPGEALNLRWVDIDFNLRMLTIAPRPGWTTKTRRGRIVPIPEELLDFLQNRRESIKPDTESVCGIRPESAKKKFRVVVKRAGLPIQGEQRVSAHVCRHSYASHLVQKGIPLFTVGVLLGHSNQTVTALYAHLSPEHLKGVSGNVKY